MMFAYSIIKLSFSVVSSIALAAIALSFCSVKQQSKVFNECVAEIKKLAKVHPIQFASAMVGKSFKSTRSKDNSAKQIYSSKHY